AREDEVLANMQAQQVSQALCVSVNIEQWPRVTGMAERHANVFASLGVHPDYEDVTEPDVAQLVDMSAHPRVVAIGETGLDYFRLTGDLEWQRKRFRTHIRAARECGKPLIIHTRSS
ncbi:TatD family hydrolase, partial [Salmonella enterica subsp. enterica serovar Typhimurium]|nr:TatD family hydrolase [Salmonella enterica subsp. enterica serovar Typhimurium]